MTLPYWFTLTRHDGPTPPPPPATALQPSTPAPTPMAPAPQPADPPKPGDPVDKPLGPAGERALAAEREARKALEKQVAVLAPLAKLAEAIGGGDPAKGKTELETLAEKHATLEKQLADERFARWRVEVAAEKGLTAAQAARLVGNTREELATDADALKALFPTPPSASGMAPGTPPAPAPRTPNPDPSQGRGGNNAATDFRTASPAEVSTELAKLGIRTYS